MPPPLPIDAHLPRIADALGRKGSVVVVAPPGAGKTTRVPPALAEEGKTIVLQPRRIAARSLARRIADERGWTLGGEVGWQVRFEKRFGEDTRLLVATEGILTARFHADPLLSEFGTVVLDEFHERSIHLDLGLAFAREARRARGDLRIVVMSATLDPGPVAAYLGEASVVEVEASPHPVEIVHEAHVDPVEAAIEVLSRPGGHLLVFFPGAREIRRAEEALARRIGGRADVRVLPLHGSLDADAQDAALARFAGRKVVLATNLAETSLTIEGVTDVIDTGLHRVPRRDPATGIDRLTTERISKDSAAQRAGRAGRTGPGRCLRLWDPRDEMRERREPEIERVDLASPLLDVLAWGADPASFPWFESPPAASLDEARTLLDRIGAAKEGALTPLGDRLHRLPVHPRVGRVLLAAEDREEAAAALAAFEEGWAPRGDPVATDCDLLLRASRIGEAPPRVRRAAEALSRLSGGGSERLPFRRALLLGFPDRVAKRREPGSPSLLLRSGTGAVLGRESGVRDGELLLALDVGGGAEPIVRAASRVEKEWLEPDAESIETRLEGDAIRAERLSRLGAIVLSSAPATPDPEEAARLLAAALLARGLDEASDSILRRCRFAGIEVDLPALARAACEGRTRLPKFDLGEWIPPGVRRDLARLAPERLPLPSGRAARLDYREDGTVVAAVKLQELFGLAETPRVGARGEPVVFELLAPNGRPVQTTSDLRSFWQRTYPEVRKELRGRYPKHPWPEDPWTAKPTHRTKRQV